MINQIFEHNKAKLTVVEQLIVRLNHKLKILINHPNVTNAKAVARLYDAIDNVIAYMYTEITRCRVANQLDDAEYSYLKTTLDNHDCLLNSLK